MVQEVKRDAGYKADSRNYSPPAALLIGRSDSGTGTGVKAVGIKNVSINEDFFAGIFGNPIMPGVLIVEALAQVGLWRC